MSNRTTFFYESVVYPEALAEFTERVVNRAIESVWRTFLCNGEAPQVTRKKLGRLKALRALLAQFSVPRGGEGTTDATVARSLLINMINNHYDVVRTGVTNSARVVASCAEDVADLCGRTASDERAKQDAWISGFVSSYTS